MKFNISFTDTKYAPVVLNEGAELSENLTVQNSPILFGCRIGICGTCLIRVHEESLDSPLHPRTHNESEFIEGLFPGDSGLRLACQIKINTNIKIKKEKI